MYSSAGILLALMFCFVLAIVLSFVRRTILFPRWVRNHMLKYKSVYVSDRFVPIKGDIDLLTRSIAIERQNAHHYIFQEVQKNPEIEFGLLNAGEMVVVQICSVEGLNELKDLIPSTIDRS